MAIGGGFLEPGRDAFPSNKINMLNWLKKKIQTAEAQHYDTVCPVVGEFGGHKVRAFTHVEYLPTKRYLFYLNSTQEADLGVSRNDLMAFTKGMRDAYKDGKHTKVGWYVETLAFYLDAHAPDKMLFKTGSCLIMIDDENPSEVTEKHQKLKAELFDTDEDFRAFFLQITFQLLKRYGNLSSDISEEDFTNLVASKEERIFSRLTGRRIYWDYLSD
jgi:hypothetical protein